MRIFRILPTGKTHGDLSKRDALFILKKMEDSCVHHIEFEVQNGESLQRNFIQQYRFHLAATRFNKLVKQWVLKSGSSTCLITQQISSDNKTVEDQYFVGYDRNTGCTKDKLVSNIDSVFNVALKVKNVSACIERLSRSGVKVLRPEEKFSDEHGDVSLAVVKSCIGNVVHTLIDDRNYYGDFLPGFKSADNVPDKNVCEKDMLVTHFDHVTFACGCGDSDIILEWYSKCFGMKRFMINR